MSQRCFDPAATCATLVELLQWRARHQPTKQAYTFLVDGESAEVHVTYAQLDRQARSIAARLQEIGTQGERALLLYPAGLHFIAAFFGCLYGGLIAVPAYPPHPARLQQALSRLLAMVHDARPVVALTTSALLSKLEATMAHVPDLSAVHWLATDSSSSMADAWLTPRVTSDTLAFLQYTSGSTTKPKGVMVSHANLLHNARMIQRGFCHTEDCIVVGWLPFYHDMGLIGNILQPFYLGARALLMPPEAFLLKPWRWLQAISRYRAHTSGGPNFAYDLCVSRITPAQRATLDLSSWRVACNGAEPIRPETLEQFSTAFAPCGFRPEAFYPCYGLAEATLFVTGGAAASSPVLYGVQAEALAHHHVRATAGAQTRSQTIVGCGHTWGDQRIAIVDPATCSRCPPDTVGEIWVAGPSVALGYWNRPEETARTFHAYIADTGEGPFLRTGDLGFLQDGELFVTGRLKDLIIISGRNHYPQDIEQTVTQSHAALRPGGCAVFSVDIAGIEQLIVVAEVERQYRLPSRQQGVIAGGAAPPDHRFDAEAVVQTIRQAVAECHELRVHTALLLKTGSIPKTSSGKIQRHMCRARFLDGSMASEGEHHAPTVSIRPARHRFGKQ